MTKAGASIGRLAPALAALVLVMTGCGSPEPTACPVPTAPAETTPTACPVPTAPVAPLPEGDEPVCGGGTLTPSQAFELLSDSAAGVTAIDTRSGGEYADGHIPGALHLNSSSSSFDDKLDELPRDGAYLVYCRSGGVSARVLERMLDMGFERVCHIGTGFNGWQGEGFPVEKGAA